MAGLPARTGGFDASTTDSVNAFLGGTGTRSWTTSLTHTWGDAAGGVEAEDGVMVFVR